MNRHTTFTLLYHSLSSDNQRRTVAFMRAVRTHAGRAWVMLDHPLEGMPPRIIGMK